MVDTWTTDLPDWETRILAGESMVPCGALFPEEAEAARKIFSELKIVDLPGQPRAGDITRKWVFDFVDAIFGAYDRESGRRLITEFFLLISKKNTKSTTAAEIMLTALIRNWRRSAEFLILAPTREVADNSFYPARDSIRQDEELKALLHIQPHIRTITHRLTGATLKVVAADSEAVSGKKAAGVLIDELWLFGRKRNAENMLREATGGLASRPEGFIIYLTTQSDEPPEGVFKQKLEYARQVRDGEIIDPEFLPVLYEFPQHLIDTKAYLDPKNFYITNPNLGASVDAAYLERNLVMAKSNGGDSLTGFLAKHLNIEIGMNLRADRWVGADFWQDCTDPTLSLETLIERSEVITVGIDGGGLDDLLGLAVMGRDEETKDWLLWCKAWAHPSVLDRHNEIAERLKDLEKEGQVVLVKRAGEDVRQVADLVALIENSDLLNKIGVDPIGIGAVLDELEEVDVPADKIVGISQGWKLGGAIKTIERKLTERTIQHPGTGLMTWCVGNARIEQRANSILITKQASGSAKIDPLMAALNAASLMSMNPKSMSTKYQLMVM